MLFSAKTQDSTLPSSNEEPDPVKSQAYCFPGGSRGSTPLSPEGLSPGTSAHQGLKPRGSDSLGLHRGKMHFLPLWAEMLFYAQQIRMFV